MSYGLEVSTSTGRVITLGTVGVTIVDLISVASGGSGSKSYAGLAGLSLKWSVMPASASAFGIAQVTVSYDYGYPVLSWTPGYSPVAPTASNILVFAQ